MMYKLLGAGLVVIASGGVGLSMVVAYKNEVRCLRVILAALSYMKCELQFHSTSLPILCKKAAAVATGPVKQYFEELSNELDSQICPDIQSCSLHALSKVKQLPKTINEIIIDFSSTLGSFDLMGQLKGLDHSIEQAERMLEKLSAGQEQRLRNYQTLSLCAGAALAIILV